MKKIFLVEDDAEICDIINEYFGNKGVEVAFKKINKILKPVAIFLFICYN